MALKTHWIRAAVALPIYIATLALVVWCGFALTIACLAGGGSPMLGPALRLNDPWVCALVAAGVALSQLLFLWPLAGVLRVAGPVRSRGPTVLVGALVLGLVSLALGLVINDLFPLDGADLGALRLAGLASVNAAAWGAMLLRGRALPVGGLIHRALIGTFGAGAVVLVVGLGLVPEPPADRVGPAVVAQVLAGTMLLWAAGPLVLLVFLRARFEAWWRACCTTCGYRRGVDGAIRCPECGTAYGGDDTAIAMPPAPGGARTHPTV